MAATLPFAQTVAQEARFDILELRVNGNTVLPAAVIEETIYPFVGESKSAVEVNAARAALEKVYQDRGFVTVSVEVPRQDVRSGVIVLDVLERPVSRVKVVGARFHSPDRIRGGAPSVAEGSVIDLNAVQRDMARLNQWNARRVTPDLKPSERHPNSVEVDLKVEDRFPVSGSAELNNQRSANTKPLRLGGTLRYENLWQRGDTVSLTYQTAPQRRSDSEVTVASYLFRVPDSDVSLLATYIKSDSDVATLANQTVLGRGTTVQFRALVPLDSESGLFSSLAAGIDYKRSTDQIQGRGVGAVRSDDPDSGPDSGQDSGDTGTAIESWSLVAGYTANWQGDRRETELGLRTALGLRGIGSDTADFDAKRFRATPNFLTAQIEASHLEKFENDLQLWGRVQSQFANEPLISNEQFSIGGAEAVRGYLEAEASGDYGASIQLELRSPSYGARIASFVDDLRFHTFLDAGSVEIHDPLPGEDRSSNIASAGAGIRIRLWGSLIGSLEGAFALLDGPDTPAGGRRALFRLASEF